MLACLVPDSTALMRQAVGRSNLLDPPIAKAYINYLMMVLRSGIYNAGVDQKNIHDAKINMIPEKRSLGQDFSQEDFPK